MMVGCAQVKFWLSIGLDKKQVFLYRLKRVQGQGPLLSKLVRWGVHSAPADFTALSTEGLVCTDISNGKETRKVPQSHVQLLRHLPQ